MHSAALHGNTSAFDNIQVASARTMKAWFAPYIGTRIWTELATMFIMNGLALRAWQYQAMQSHHYTHDLQVIVYASKCLMLNSRTKDRVLKAAFYTNKTSQGHCGQQCNTISDVRMQSQTALVGGCGAGCVATGEARAGNHLL